MFLPHYSKIFWWLCPWISPNTSLGIPPAKHRNKAGSSYRVPETAPNLDLASIGVDEGLHEDISTLAIMASAYFSEIRTDYLNDR
ncbi:hypothetical protein LIER_30104 [Lithospermum erythrorhizon]|uniref:Uncharacterized protein n=1 Tax=Lithospermum erythrorhizon TaxID=34254 RepID=A0AAV3RQ67_LITER